MPLPKVKFRLRRGGQEHRRSAGAPAHAGQRQRPRRQLPVEGVQRSVPLLRGDDPGDLGPHRRDRSRHALGLCQQARAFRAVGCAGFEDVSTAAGSRGPPSPGQYARRMRARGATSLYGYVDGQRPPAPDLLRLSEASATSRSRSVRASWCSADVKRAQRRGQAERRARR